ncbi:MAG: TetR family transcriptional regulator [Gammaproteobacteria bacterium]|nr:TetR family transcriptional regulator [Gammaproteobacteria bacterium]
MARRNSSSDTTLAGKPNKRRGAAPRNPQGDRDSRELKNEVIAFKRRRILEEAAHLFFVNGYEGTTLDSIAQQLQVTKPYLYSYFNNKSEILFEICQTGIRHALTALDEALVLEAKPGLRLKAVVEKVARIVIDKREYVAVYQREEKNLRPEEARVIKTMRKEFDRRIGKLLAEGIECREFAMDDISVTATTIGGILSWLPNWYLPAGRLSESEVITYTVKLVNRMVEVSKPVGRN